MTSPTPAPNFAIGSTTPDGTGLVTRVRRSAIHSLELLVYTLYPTYDAEGNMLTGYITRYAVMGRVSADVRVRLATFTELAEAETYIRDDPDGLFD